MEQTVIVKGRLVGPRNVELAEPVSAVLEEVEVALHPCPASGATTEETLSEFLRRLPPGTRTKEDIDRQIRQEREARTA